MSPLGALVGRSPRYEGVFVLPVYVAAGAAGAWLLGPSRRRGAMPWFLRTLAVVAVAVALEAVLEAFGLRPLPTNVARPGSLLGNAGDEGALGVLLLGPLAAVASRARDPWFVAGAVASLVIVVLSASRGALLGAVAVVALLVLLGPSRRARLLLAGAAVALVAATFAGAGHPRPGPWHEPACDRDGLRSHPAVERVTSAGGSPWAHRGRAERVPRRDPAEHNRTWQAQVGPANPPDSPHDWVLQAASDGGIPLALLAVALAATVLWRGRRAASGQPSPAEDAAFAGMWAGLAGYGVALLFAFTSPGTTPLAAFFGGALVALPPAGVRVATAAAGGRSGRRGCSGGPTGHGRPAWRFRRSARAGRPC